METKAFLEKELKEIAKWEKGQNGLFIWERIARIPFVILDKLTPKFIQKRINILIDGLATFVDHGGRYLINEKAVLKHYDITWIGEVESLPLTEMDVTAEKVIRARVRFARIQGATTGVGGIFTLVADIPLLLGTSLKVLQEMAIVYGFDPREKSERVFIIKCLQFVNADVVGKKAILQELSQFGAQSEQTQIASQIQGWREVVNTYRDHISWKKLLQAVPIAGIFFGAIINKGVIEDVGEAGKMLYKKRRIKERLLHLNTLKKEGKR